MTGATVYIVDDDDGVRAALAFLLKTAQYSVQEFASARQFLELKSIAFPTCLLTDFRMAGMNGLELQTEVALRFPKLPVVLMTGHDGALMAASAKEAGAIEFLLKPFDDGKLLAGIQQSIQLSMQSRRMN